MNVNLGELLLDLQSQLAAVADRLKQLDPTFEFKPRTGPDKQSRTPYGSTVRLVTGVIADYVPFYDAYRVLLEGVSGPIMCGRAKSCSTAATGVTDSDTLVGGDRVLVSIHRSERHGHILSVLPGPTLDRRLSLHNQISQASPLSRAADPFAADLAARPTNDLIDFSGSSPIDQSGVGEFSRGCAATGTLLHVDPYMVTLRTSEECGVTATLADDTLRVAGRTLQVWTAGGETLTAPTGGGGVSEYVGFTPFEWEGLGGTAAASTTSIAVSAIDSQVNTPHLGSAEPAAGDQAPLYRFTRDTGPRAGGRREQVVLPVPTSTAVNRLSDPTDRLTVRDEYTGLDGGGYCLNRTGGERGMRPGLSAYAPTLSADDEPPPQSAIPAPFPGGTIPDGVGSALVVDDLFAYRQLASDIGYVQAGWSKVSDGGGELPVDFSALASTYSVPDPQPTPLPVSPGATAATYPRAAGDTTLPNGTRVIFGPCGEEIRMGGGVLELSAPTVVIRSGRDVVVMAGRDAVLRSRRDTDVSAAVGSVRIKADKDLHALAGNSGQGSVLLESRSDLAVQAFGPDGSQSGGVIIKTTGDLVQYCRTAYTRATSAHVTETDGLLVQSGELAYRFLTTGGFDSYGPKSEPSAVSVFGPTTLIGGSLQVVGRLGVTEGATFGDTIVVSSGHIVTADAEQYAGQVPGLDDDSVKRQAEQVAAVVQADLDSRSRLGLFYTDFVTDGLGGEYRPGNALTITSTAFGFRASAAIGLDGFVLYETRWQQRARLGGQSLPAWDEPVVTGPGGALTLPYPGYDVWSTACFRTVDLGLYDVVTGRPSDLASPQGATYRQPVASSPSQSYLTIS